MQINVKIHSSYNTTYNYHNLEYWLSNDGVMLSTIMRILGIQQLFIFNTKCFMNIGVRPMGLRGAAAPLELFK